MSSACQEENPVGEGGAVREVRMLEMNPSSKKKCTVHPMGEKQKDQWGAVPGLGQQWWGGGGGRPVRGTGLGNAWMPKLGDWATGPVNGLV